MAPRFIRSLWVHRQLLRRLTRQEILMKYQGSTLGMAWTIFNPLLMLVVYTFVFSQVFRARWTTDVASPLQFAVNLFAGLIVFNLFSEGVIRAPQLITQNPNYVKKVIFPLEILVPVVVCSSLFHACCSLVVLFAFQLLVLHQFPLGYLWLPLVWLPLVLGTLAVGWILAMLGVFLRDINQVIVVLVNMLMFLSPIFYPVAALPTAWRPLLMLNPLASVIEQTRTVLLLGSPPSPAYVVLGTLFTVIACECCWRIFSRAKRAFADVI